MVEVRQFEAQLCRLGNWAWWRFDLKRYYPYYSAFVLLDGAFLGLVAFVAWLLYSPYVYYGTRLLIDFVLLVSEKMVTPLVSHPDAVPVASTMVRELLDVETTGNTMIALFMSISLWRMYVAYTIYKRGSREANERL